MTKKLLNIIDMSGFNMFTLYEYAAVKYYLNDTEYKFMEVRDLFKKTVLLHQAEYLIGKPKHQPFLEEALLEVFARHVEPQMRRRFRILIGYLKTRSINIEEYDFEDWEGLKGFLEEMLFLRFEETFGFDFEPLNDEKEQKIEDEQTNDIQPNP